MTGWQISVREFLDSVNEGVKPTLNVGSSVPQAVVLGGVKRR